MSIAKVTAINEVARHIIDSLKSGGLLKGTVQSRDSYGSTNIAWVAIQFPEVGYRQVPVKSEQHLQPGQEVFVECVPNPHKPGCYVFQMAAEPLSPEAV